MVIYGCQLLFRFVVLRFCVVLWCFSLFVSRFGCLMLFLAFHGKLGSFRLFSLCHGVLCCAASFTLVILVVFGFLYCFFFRCFRVV